MSDIAIKVENLSKRYRIGLSDELPDTLVGAVTQAVKRPLRNWRRLRRLTAFQDDGRPSQPSNLQTSQPSNASGIRTDVDGDTIWALKDVSFEVERGEVVGIIGRNGAGKSTLLKILSQITAPTEGRAVINGRVGSLLEVGTGFHPELTGRENVYLNGAILGMTKAEIDGRFDEIVAFSGVEKFIDTPVKRYSSGMRVRLAFSVAAHLDPEILLVDEVLAVGDVTFQKKCLGKMGSVAKEGRTVLFVSHDMAAVESLCEKAVMLVDGLLAEIGATDMVIADYLSTAHELADCDLAGRTDREGTGDLRFTSVSLVGGDGKPVDSVSTGQRVGVRLDYETTRELSWDHLQVSIGFRDNLGQFLFNCPSDVVAVSDRALPSRGSLTCTIPRFPLPPGNYRFNIFSAVKEQIADWVKNAGSLEVDAGDYYGTGRLPPHNKGVLVDFKWEVLQKD